FPHAAYREAARGGALHHQSRRHEPVGGGDRRGPRHAQRTDDDVQALVQGRPADGRIDLLGKQLRLLRSGPSADSRSEATRFLMLRFLLFWSAIAIAALCAVPAPPAQEVER